MKNFEKKAKYQAQVCKQQISCYKLRCCKVLNTNEHPYFDCIVSEMQDANNFKNNIP